MGPERLYGNTLTVPGSQAFDLPRRICQQTDHLVPAHGPTSEGFPSVPPCALTVEGYLTPPHGTEDPLYLDRLLFAHSSECLAEPDVGQSQVKRMKQMAHTRIQFADFFRVPCERVATEPSYRANTCNSPAGSDHVGGARAAAYQCAHPSRTNQSTALTPTGHFPSSGFSTDPGATEIKFPPSLPRLCITPAGGHTNTNTVAGSAHPNVRAKAFAERVTPKITTDPPSTSLSEFEPSYAMDGYHMIEADRSISMTRIRSHSSEVSPAPSYDSAYGSAGSAIFSDLQPQIVYQMSPRIGCRSDIDGELEYLGNPGHVKVSHSHVDDNLSQSQPTTTNKRSQHDHLIHNIERTRPNLIHRAAIPQYLSDAKGHEQPAQAMTKLLNSGRDVTVGSASNEPQTSSHDKTGAICTCQCSKQQQTASESEPMRTSPPFNIAAITFPDVAESQTNHPSPANYSSFEDHHDSSGTSTSQSSPEAELVKPMSPTRKREIVEELMKEFNDRFQSSTPSSWDEDYEDEDECEDEDDNEYLSPGSQSTGFSSTSGSSGIRELPEGMARQHQDAGESRNGSQTPGDSSTGNQGRKRGAGGKRKKAEEDTPGRGSDNDGNGGRKRHRNNEETPSSQLSNDRKLACPFRKRHPDTHKNTACIYPGFPNVARVKGHIYRLHMQPPHCSRCYQKFESEDLLKKHEREDNRCKVIPEDSIPRIEGVTKDMERQLRSKKQHRDSTEEQKWIAMYRILFPNDENVPNPYCDLDPQSQTEQRLSPNSKNFAEFERFNRRTVPELVRQGIEAAANYQETIFIETLRSQLSDIVRRAYDEALRQWQTGEGRHHATEVPSSGNTANALGGPARGSATTANEAIDAMMMQPPESTQPCIAAGALSSQRNKHGGAPADSTYGSSRSYGPHQLPEQPAIQQESSPYPLATGFQPITIPEPAVSMAMGGTVDPSIAFQPYHTPSGSTDAEYWTAGMEFPRFVFDDSVDETDAPDTSYY